MKTFTKSVISLKKLPGMSDEIFGYAEAFDRYGPFGTRYYADEIHLVECKSLTSYAFSGEIATDKNVYRIYYELLDPVMLVEVYSSDRGFTGSIWSQEYALTEDREYISVDDFMKYVNRAYGEILSFIEDREGVSVSSRKDNKMVSNRRFSARELTGRERMFLQICHNLWKWIKDGHGASSFFETEQAEAALSDIEKIMGKRGMQAENIILALYDRVDDLAFKIDREKRLNSPEVQKAMTEIDGLAGNHDSTRLGRIIAEEIANDMGIRTASLAAMGYSRVYSRRTSARRSYRRYLK